MIQILRSQTYDTRIRPSAKGKWMEIWKEHFDTESDKWNKNRWIQGIACWFSGQDSVLLLLRVQVQSLVGELVSYKLHGAGKEKKKDTKNEWAGRRDPGPLQGGSRGDWRWKMERLKGSEDGSWRADPEGDRQGPEGMFLSSPECRQMRVYSWRRHLTVDEEKFSDPITGEFKDTEDRAAISQLSDDRSRPPTMKQECSWPQASPQRTGNLIFWINITLNLELYNSPNCHWTIRT